MNFSPYQPPPDVPLEEPPAAKNTKGKGRPWFARDASHQSGYQAGGSASDPSVAGTAFTNDPEADAYGSGSGGGGGYGGNAYSYSSSSGGAGPSNGAYAYGGGGQGIEGGSGDEGRVNAWESRFGWRIDLMAAATYLGGPVTALLFLILETQNDYVRFHAYQSALLTTPLVTFILLTNLLLPFPAFLKTIIVLGGVGVTLYAAYRAYKDAQEGLGRYWLPYIGEVAERWVNDE